VCRQDRAATQPELVRRHALGLPLRLATLSPRVVFQYRNSPLIVVVPAPLVIPP
jgi:hypothetical protein